MTAITIDLRAKTPPFEQIKRAIAGAIGQGTLANGHRLPTIRQLAGDLGVAPNTVARAYRELETEGFVRSQGRRGTVVLTAPAAASNATESLGDAVRRARRSGMSDTEIVHAVWAALD